MRIKKILTLLLAVLLLLSLSACDAQTQTEWLLGGVPGDGWQTDDGRTGEQAARGEAADIPDYSDAPYVVLQENLPDFSAEALPEDSFEQYSRLDSLGRCGKAYACIGLDLMPNEKRGSIGSVKPSGWQTTKYDEIDGKYLYNRCHLIGYQLSGENANEKNLITGTRYMNVEGMLPFENLVADYVKETGNHVLYRVTPWFTGDNLVADGVEMEAMSVEDAGEGVLFHVFVYNVQPGITIDYATGDSHRAKAVEKDRDSTETQEKTYILNVNSRKFHRPDCSGAATIAETNKQTYTGKRDDLLKAGYTPCGTCKP